MALTLRYTLKDFDKGKIIDRFNMQDGGKADLFLANTCFKRMTKYVPWKTGMLATTVTVRPKSVTYEQPYAHRQYTTNKGSGLRGKYWDKKMIANERDIIVKEIESYIKERG